MSTVPQPHQQTISGTSATHGGQTFAGIVHGNVYYGTTSPHSPLSTLPYARDAPFNSLTRQHELTCLENTRIDVLGEINRWANSGNGERIFWLSGLAGTGKSTIARTVARSFYEKNRLGASFFFSRGGGDVSNAEKFVTSIALQLASSIPSLDEHICDVIKERPDITSQSLRDQWQQLVLRPLSRLASRNCHPFYILVVDALDECENENNARIVLRLLAEARSIETIQLRVFLTSRPKASISSEFRHIPDLGHREFILHNIQPSLVDHDISVFLEHNLALIGLDWSLGIGWPGKDTIESLVRNAGGLFIWAATARRFIGEGKQFAAKRLETILMCNRSVVTAPEKHLNDIYLTVLKQSVSSEYTNEEREELYYMLRYVLGSIAILFSPLSPCSLSRILDVTNEYIELTLADLHSILNIALDRTHPLRLHHPSFTDFLLNRERCSDLNFWVDEERAHQKLTEKCLHLMSASLKQDVCGIESPGTLVADVDSHTVERYLPQEVQYACLYWVQHLQKSGTQLYDNDQVHRFLLEHLLHWLEALGWMRKVYEGIYAVTYIETLASECPQLSAFIYDTLRFVQYHRPAIEHAPLQIYSSALIFSPTTSIVRNQFEGCIPTWIRRLPAVANNWGDLLQTVEGDSGSIYAVAFSPEGKVLASGGKGGTVRLWDTSTGQALHRLDGHLDDIIALVFSKDGKILATASEGISIKLWDVSTGENIQEFYCPCASVMRATFSPDGSFLAFFSKDGPLEVFDLSTESRTQVVDGEFEYSSHITFSVDGRLAAVVSGNTIVLWNLHTNRELYNPEGSSSGGPIALSTDAVLLASAWNDGTVRIIDTNTEYTTHIFELFSNFADAIVFSADGNLLATGSYEGIIELWNIETAVRVQIFERPGDICAIAFSPNSKLLVSGGLDGNIRLWAVSTEPPVQTQTLEGDSKLASPVVFSPDGKLLAFISTFNTIKLWDASTGVELQSLKGHKKMVWQIVFSPNSKLIASGSWDNTIRLWDVDSGLQILQGYSGSVNVLSFSPEGDLLASASDEKTIKLWDTSTGVQLKAMEGHSGWVTSLAFSPKGKLLGSASKDNTIKIWDIETGAEMKTFKGDSERAPFGRSPTMAFSPNGKLVASAADGKTVKVWNIDTGVETKALEGQPSYASALAFSPGDKVLALAFRDGVVKLWDIDSGVVLEASGVESVLHTLTFSHDCSFLHTERGTLYPSFGSTPDPISRQDRRGSLFVKERWVCRGAENILWLPDDYRSKNIDVHANTVALGYGVSQISVIELDFEEIA